MSQQYVKPKQIAPSGTDGDVLTTVGGVAQWQPDSGGSGGGGHVIEDEGTPLTARANLNFVGTGVAATDDAGNNASVVTVNKWFPLGNGDSTNPSLIFAAGAPVMVEQLT